MEMTSSNRTDDILSARGLNLVFPLRYYHERTLRGAFIDLVRNPRKALLGRRESLHVLKDISFSVQRGERLAILGVNGSGKTSLCRCIAGMLHPVSGQLQVNGGCRAIFDAGVGVIPELTGRENAHLLATFMYPEESSENRSRMVDEAVEFSELGSFLNVPYETYSLGMRARLFLSIATAKPANLLILDEVYDNTDRFFQRKMTERLMSFIRNAQAVVFVSHSPEIVRRVCNRAIVLHQSRIAFDGPVEDALATYDALNGRVPEETGVT